VIAAPFLVIGLRLTPRRGSVMRVFAITAAYTAFVGCFNWLTGSNYIYLAAVPTHGSLLSVLGPWPWYILSAAAVGSVLLLILDAPFYAAGAWDRTGPGVWKGPARSRIARQQRRRTLQARTGRTTMPK